MNELNTLITSEESQEHTEFWKKTLDSVGGDFRLRPNWRSYAAGARENAEHEVVLDESTALFVEQSARGKDLGVFVIVLAGVSHLIRIYSGSHTILVDSPPLRLNGESGGYAGAVPLVTEIEDDGTVRSHMNRVRAVVSDSYTYQDFPIERVATVLLRQKGRPSTNVLVRLPRMHAPVAGTEFYDLTIDIQRDAGLRIRLQGRSGVFSFDYLRQFGRHLANLLSGYRQADLRLADVPVIDAAERAQLLSENTGPSGTIGETALGMFRHRAEQAPGAIALAIGQKRLTYLQLDECSNRLAHFLRDEYGLKRGDVVGVLCDRSELWVIALLAILKAQGVYLPVDPEYPEERIRFMAEDASARVLLVHSQYLSRLTELYTTPMFALDFQLDTLETPATAPDGEARLEDAAYIIYTSGSTGQPKGVVLEHRGLANMVWHHIKAFGIGSSDRLSQFYAPSFDSSLFEVFVALASGATLVMTSRETIKDPAQFSECIRAYGVTTLTAPPVFLSTLDRQKMGTVKRIVSAGDNARVEDALDFARSLAYYNSYGPTEASVCVTHYRVDAGVAYGSRIPIGRPIHNTYLLLLDESLRLVPKGCIGEICIGGASLARGYLNRADLTEAAFVVHPFEPGARLYRTGDLGVWLPDGNLELVGRRDTQVKIRGYRIELGEIEAVLSQHPEVNSAAVVAREDQPGDRRLVAYVSSAQSPTGAALREYLKHRLPEFMIPSVFVVLAEMPLTANGKIDRKSLPDPKNEAGDASSYAPPENPMQERLARIWSEVLGVPGIGIHDNFFELGGDSILIILTVSRANKQGIRITPQQIFERQTVAALSEIALDTKDVTADQAPVTGSAPLMPMQRWFFSQPLEERHHYNQSVMLGLPDDLDEGTLREAARSLIEHHDALRLRFVEQDGGWRQEHAPADEADEDVPFGASFADEEAEVQAKAAQLQASLNISEGPLLRIHLFRSARGRSSRLLFIVHHLVVDGVSWRILFEDFDTACRQLSQGQDVSLPPRTTSFQAWAHRLEEFAQTDFEGLGYWTADSLSHAARLPVDRAVPPERNTVSTAAEVTSLFDEEHTRSLLHEAPQAFNTHIDDILLTALLLAFREWTGDSRLLVDLEGHGREDLFEDMDLSRTVGWFTALYPVRLEADPKASQVDALKSVKEQLRAVPLHGLGYGLARYLRNDGKVRERLIANPPAEVLFNYLGQTDRILAAGTGWKPVLDFNSPEQSPGTRRSHLLEVTGIVFDGCLRMTWNYTAEIHDRSSIERLANRFSEILVSLIETCRSSPQRGFTPSDFPAARIDQKTLDALVAGIG
jgi:amino acid adenylation domain-containing protein/non-ribosomal peptide synthase protein (TIGR01720 family)